MTNPLLLDDQLCFAVYAASRAMTSVYRPVLDELGLTYPQYLALMVLWEHAPAPVTVSQLGARLQLDSGTLTPLLKRLEGLGFVERQRRAEDERVVDVSLTANGKRLRQRALKVPEAMMCRVNLTRAQVGALRDQLKALTKHLNEEQPAAPKEDTP